MTTERPISTYHGKTIEEMSRADLIQCVMDVGAMLDRERRSWARERAALELQAEAPPPQRRRRA